MEFVPTSDNDGTMTKGNTRWNEEGEIFSTTATKKKENTIFLIILLHVFLFLSPSNRVDLIKTCSKRAKRL